MKRLRHLDWFFLGNLALFALMCACFYVDRFSRYFGEGRLLEFIFYAACIGGGVATMWLACRRLPLHWPVLAALQAGIVLHYCGGLMDVNGIRVYDWLFLAGIRFDKYVHLYNAFAIGLLVQHLIDIMDMQLRAFRGLVVLLIVLGLGAVVEIIEFLFTRMVIVHGVGDYVNNMGDLLANLAGGVLLLAAWQWPAFRRLASPAAANETGMVSSNCPAPERTNSAGCTHP